MDDSLATPRLDLPPRLPSLIFLNGPAGSGKTTLAEALMALDPGITSYHHANPLWGMLDQIVDFDPETQQPMNFEDPAVKNSAFPLPTMPGIRRPLVRAALVDLGLWVRETFGPGILGYLALQNVNILLKESDTVVLPGARTLDDILPFLNGTNPREVLVFRLFREGTSWSGDLGGYIDPADLPHVRVIDLHNNGTPEDLVALALGHLGVPA